MPSPFADFALYPFAVINHSPKYNPHTLTLPVAKMKCLLEVMETHFVAFFSHMYRTHLRLLDFYHKDDPGSYVNWFKYILGNKGVRETR